MGIDMYLKGFVGLCVFCFSIISLGNVAKAASNGQPVQSLLEARQENVVIQKWDLSCGAAALTTLLKFQHGDMLEEKDVAQELIQRKEYVKNPSLIKVREGFSLFDLKRYVDNRGYQGLGYGKLKLQDLIERAPIMVAVNLNGYNHFVIFRGMTGNRILIADPAWGNRTMLREKFLDSWIEYPVIGKVGFVVVKSEGNAVENYLEPDSKDFVFLR